MNVSCDFRWACYSILLNISVVPVKNAAEPVGIDCVNKKEQFKGDLTIAICADGHEGSGLDSHG